MKWFVGVDGGGTKTAFIASTAQGAKSDALVRTGCSYQVLGIAAAVAVVADGVRSCLESVGAGLTDCAGCTVGMPCYGENAENDIKVAAALQSALSPAPVHVVNDVEVGWAGSLECREGINVVAGTGSIAFGCGKEKQTARCGGWTEFFGDEGSCYWVGREAMSLFSKEADGRVPRGALYELVRRELDITQDYDFIDIVLRDFAAHRENVAKFQLYACRAAEDGDAAAADLFRAAAHELTLMVAAVKRQLVFSVGAVNVSYTGGLFKAGELILRPFREGVSELGCVLVEPRSTPVEGALLMAIQRFSGVGR